KASGCGDPAADPRLVRFFAQPAKTGTDFPHGAGWISRVGKHLLPFQRRHLLQGRRGLQPKIRTHFPAALETGNLVAAKAAELFDEVETTNHLGPRHIDRLAVADIDGVPLRLHVRHLMVAFDARGLHKTPWQHGKVPEMVPFPVLAFDPALLAGAVVR